MRSVLFETIFLKRERAIMHAVQILPFIQSVMLLLICSVSLELFTAL